VADLLARADFAIEDGPLLGSCGLAFATPLRVGVPYDVVGEIVDVERKQGRSGTFDVLRFRERLLDAVGTEVASATNVFILPRQAAA
jgi:hydroxyacyl-ACP dehydratase HTD2-like protein with hotdog domain